MSVYMEVSGEIYFESKEEARKAIDFLLKGGWLKKVYYNGRKKLWETSEGDVAFDMFDNDNIVGASWMSEGFPVSTEPVPLDEHYLLFNGGICKDMGRALFRVLDFKIDGERTEYKTVSTDGCFSVTEFSQNEMKDVELDKEHFKEVIGCYRDEIIYDEEELSEEDKKKYAKRLYSNASDRAFEWVNE